MAQRKKDVYRIEKVDTVPTNYYPMDVILKTSPIRYPEDKIYKARYFSMHNMVDRMRAENETNLKKYWYEKVNSTIADQTISSDIIHFGKVLQLAPIVHLVEIFIININKELKNSKNKNKIEQERKNNIFYVSFGIRKDLFKQYFESGCTVIPYINKIETMKTKKKEKGTTIGVDGTKSKINAVYSPILEQWKDWCKWSGISQGVAVLEALQMQMAAYPLDGLPPLEKYYEEPNYVMPDLNVSNTEDVFNMKLRVPKDIANQMEVIVKNYNLDPLNAEKISKNDYVYKAISALNANMDLKYSNPQLYKQYMKERSMDGNA